MGNWDTTGAEQTKATIAKVNLPSIRMLINRICIGFKGLSSPSIVLTVISVNAAAAVLSWKDKKFWML